VTIKRQHIGNPAAMLPDLLLDSTNQHPGPIRRFLGQMLPGRTSADSNQAPWWSRWRVCS
jgi:hypothetical protein